MLRSVAYTHTHTRSSEKLKDHGILQNNHFLNNKKRNCFFFGKILTHRNGFYVNFPQFNEISLVYFCFFLFVKGNKQMKMIK